MLAHCKPWTYLAGGVGVILFPVMVMSFFGFLVLSHPEAGGPWICVLFMLLAVALALPAGIRGFLAARKGRSAPLASEGWLTGAGLVALVLISLTLGAGAAASLATISLSTSPVASSGFDFAADATVSTKPEHVAYDPRELAIPRGELMEISITNADPEYHDFTYESGGKTYKHPILANGKTAFLVRFDTAGTIPFRCEPHSSGYGKDDGMTGTMTVA